MREEMDGGKVGKWRSQSEQYSILIEERTISCPLPSLNAKRKQSSKFITPFIHHYSVTQSLH